MSVIADIFTVEKYRVMSLIDCKQPLRDNKYYYIHFGIYFETMLSSSAIYLF